MPSKCSETTLEYIIAHRGVRTCSSILCWNYAGNESEFGLAFFLEGLDSPAGIGRRGEVLDEGGAFKGDAVADGKVAAGLGDGLDPAEAGAALGAEGRDQIFQLLVELAGGDGAKSKTPLDGFLAGQPAPGGEKLHGPLHSDPAGETLGGASARHESEVGVLVSEAGRHRRR